jgi:hypothetical protein
MKDLKYYFNIWILNYKNKKTSKEYDQWCDINNERIDEEYYAITNNMDSIYWCWKCKYSDCDIH